MILSLDNVISTVEIFVLMFCGAVPAGLKRPLLAELVFELVPEPLCKQAMADSAVTFNVARLGGPAIGGLLVRDAGRGGSLRSRRTVVRRRRRRARCRSGRREVEAGRSSRAPRARGPVPSSCGAGCCSEPCSRRHWCLRVRRAARTDHARRRRRPRRRSGVHRSAARSDRGRSVVLGNPTRAVLGMRSPSCRCSESAWSSQVR